MGLLIGFVSGKGGAGKTTITEIVATSLNQYYDFKVAVIEVDYDQKSMTYDRENDKKKLEKGESDYLKAYDYLKAHDKKFFPIYLTRPTSIQTIAKVTKEYDITFIDVPGSMSIEGVKELFYYLDYAFVPFDVDSKSFNAQMDTLKVLVDISKTEKKRLKDFGVFFNRYYGEKGKNSGLFKNIENYLLGLGVKMLKPVYYNIEYARKYASTMVAPNPNISKKSIYTFIDDLLIKIKLK